MALMSARLGFHFNLGHGGFLTFWPRRHARPVATRRDDTCRCRPSFVAACACRQELLGASSEGQRFGPIPRDGRRRGRGRQDRAELSWRGPRPVPAVASPDGVLSRILTVGT